MAREINVVRAETPDFAALGRIVHTAVQSSTANTPAQRDAWSPAQRSAEEMAERLAGQAIFVAMDADAGPVGYMTLVEGGYIDFAYVLPSHQGRGLFSRLFADLELLARAAWTRQLTTHASMQAWTAFAAKGFRIEEPETIAQRGAWLPRFAMAKDL